MGTKRIDREAFEVGFKGWDWSMGSIQDPWHAGFHPRAARTRAKRAFTRVVVKSPREGIPTLVLTPNLYIVYFTGTVGGRLQGCWIVAKYPITKKFVGI